MSIGSRIKERREELEMTQVELAEIVGVSKGSIGNYESGVSAPNEKILYKLFSALKCDANFLYQDDMQAFSGEDKFKIKSTEKTIIKKYRSLDRFGKKAVDDILNDEYERCTYTEKIPVVVAARSAENRPVEVTYISKEKLEQIQNANSVEDEVDL